jgi:hypothetical protein
VCQAPYLIELTALLKMLTFYSGTTFRRNESILKTLCFSARDEWYVVMALICVNTASKLTANSCFSTRTRRCDSAATRAPCLFSAGAPRPRSSTRRRRPLWTRWLILALWIQVCSQTHIAHLSQLSHRCRLFLVPNHDLRRLC